MNAPEKVLAKPEGLALLREPFPAHQISHLPKGNVMLAYVGHAALTDRLLDADPKWNWEFAAVNPDGTPIVDEAGGIWIRLTVCGVTRLGYGDASMKAGGNAMKERIGDALRNAAMRFGAALDLWHKGDLHIEEPVVPTQAEIDAAISLRNSSAAQGMAAYKKAVSSELPAITALIPPQVKADCTNKAKDADKGVTV